MKEESFYGESIRVGMMRKLAQTTLCIKIADSLFQESTYDPFHKTAKNKKKCRCTSLECSYKSKHRSKQVRCLKEEASVVENNC